VLCCSFHSRPRMVLTTSYCLHDCASRLSDRACPSRRRRGAHVQRNNFKDDSSDVLIRTVTRLASPPRNPSTCKRANFPLRTWVPGFEHINRSQKNTMSLTCTSVTDPQTLSPTAYLQTLGDNRNTQQRAHDPSQILIKRLSPDVTLVMGEASSSWSFWHVW
jgi:hypothetical protein